MAAPGITTAPFKVSISNRTLTNWFGNKALIFVVENGFEFRRAGCRVDLVVCSQQDAVGDFLYIVVIPGFDAELLPRMQLAQNVSQVVFRNTEKDGDRLELSNDDHSPGIGGADDVAFIDQPQADLPADGRDDFGIGDLQIGIIDLGLIGLNGAFVLTHGRNLNIVLLFRDQPLLHTKQIALPAPSSPMPATPGREQADLSPARAGLQRDVYRFPQGVRLVSRIVLL